MPFAPGGPADFIGRLIGLKLAEEFGQQVVVDNRSGANTIVGAQAVARAKPDGYTLLLAIDGTLVMNPFLYANLPYDPFKEFVPITQVAAVPSALTANIKVPANTLKEVIDAEKAKPGTFQIGVSTPTSQVAIGLLNQLAGTNMTMVPYRGGTTQITGLLAGDIPLGHESVNVVAAALPRQEDQDHRADRHQAAGARAGTADLRRDLPRLRPRHLAERGGAGRHAEGDRRQAPRLDQEGDGDAGRARQVHCGRHRAGDQRQPRRPSPLSSNRRRRRAPRSSSRSGSRSSRLHGARHASGIPRKRGIEMHFGRSIALASRHDGGRTAIYFRFARTPMRSSRGSTSSQKNGSSLR